MTPGKPQDLDQLRRLAEGRLQSDVPTGDVLETPGQMRRLIHELQVHQVELEIQNEELRNSRLEEERLRERYSDFYDFSPTGFISLNRKGEIIQINLTGASLLGVERARLSGARLANFMDITGQREFETFLGTAFSIGGVHTCKVNLLGKGKPPMLRTVHIDATVTPGMEECRAVLIDLTKQLQAEEQQRLLEAELLQSQKLESLGSLAGGVAHNMNNVLAAILGLASIMREKADPGSPDSKHLDTIMSACIRGRDVVKGILYFVHRNLSDEGPLDLNLLAAELAQLLDSTTLMRIKFETDFQPDLPLVQGDAGALSNALMNLCINSIDAMPNGGTLTIQTRLGMDGSVALRVKDTGEGMSQLALSRAVEPFYTTKPVGKGTGLGLSMVYGILRAHEGSLVLQSHPGQGTEATMLFPASRVMLDQEPPGAATLNHESGAKDHESGAKDLDILLIDDDELVCESEAAMLRSLGHRVFVASGGEQALQFLAEGIPVDLVILDLIMPEMTGAQVLPKVLALRPSVTVLIHTGHHDESILPLLEGRLNVHCILKPFTLEELRDKIACLTFTYVCAD
jgi:signal transduction histidine kinase